MRVHDLGDALRYYTFDNAAEIGGGLLRRVGAGEARYVSPRLLKRKMSFNVNCGGNNWAGIAHQQSTAAPLQWVTGTWVTPNCAPIPPSLSGAGGAHPGFWQVAAWVGLDGTGSTPALLQAGTWTQNAPNGYQSILEATPFTLPGQFIAEGVSCFAWFEWLPGTFAVEMDGFPVSPGDTVSVVIAVLYGPPNEEFRYDEFTEELINRMNCPQTSTQTPAGISLVVSSQIGLVYVGNVTQDVFTMILMCNTDSSQFIQGATAEWIIERPTFPLGLDYKDLPPLGGFGQVIFTNVACGTTFGEAVMPFRAPMFGISGATAANTGIVTLHGEVPYSINDGHCAPVASAQVVFPGLEGLNMVQVFQPFAIGKQVAVAPPAPSKDHSGSRS